ncbi:hypothetical protein WJ69_22865 [Burkholderia ubonensis]|uniref:hypothetical protein n=1 Tax=Burkholderia ubonensis TaxID=101571 RepID=UPI0007568A94|nr:hypothetical protein [Burkholderia ubonensis]KVO05545.1 hypothetical protein WJ69_22865 [Burkholderia ubonensis]
MSALAIVYVYVVLHLTLCGAVGYLLTLPQVLAWRIVLALIQFGALWNLAGLIWLGYDNVWPGEPVITGGFCLAVFGLMFFKRPLVTNRTRAVENV